MSETIEITPEERAEAEAMQALKDRAAELAKHAADSVLQLTDPEAWRKLQFTAQHDAQRAEAQALVEAGLLSADVLSQLDQIRALQYAQEFPAPEVIPEPTVRTFAGLGLAEKKSKAAALWTATQSVEPERNGKPWCTWEDAEHLLSKAAWRAMRNGIAAANYSTVRDDSAMTLTLALRG